jgi:16S rRNA (guanine966-N2)-methyltransferase
MPASNRVYNLGLEMRIIAGRFKGLRLAVPRNKGVRPSTDRVREAIFSALGDEVVGTRALDLFAGTGAFGFEALSRGAVSTVLVERDRQVAQLLSSTTRTLGVEDQVLILTMTASKAIPYLYSRGDRFGIVFLDPPYGTDDLGSVMGNPAFPGLVESEGLLIIERSFREAAPEVAEIFQQISAKRYGDTVVEMFRKT